MIAYLIGCVGMLMVASTMRSSMHERRRDFAILRSLGASRIIVTGVILGHTFIISVIGSFGSLLVMQGIGLVSQRIILRETGVLVDTINLQSSDALVLIGIVGVGLLGGIWTAMQSYRSDLAKNLQPVS